MSSLLSSVLTMQTIDWLWILHPALAVVLIYPLIGMVVRLGVQTRARRQGVKTAPLKAGVEHTTLGAWLATGVVAIVLIALTVVISTKAPFAAFPGGAARALQLLMVLAGTVVSLIALWRAQSKGLRLLFVLLTWAGVISLGAQPEVFRLSDDPFQPAFWQSHYWAGVAVVGLMLFSLGARSEIQRQLRWRRLHVAANLLAALLFVVQGITGTRDLLEIPLNWQKPALAICDWNAQVCTPPAPAPAPALP
jgi:hypothetical protein